MKNMDESQIKAEPEKSSDSWVNLLMLLSPLFLYYYFQANRLACKPSNWDIKNVIHKY